MRSWTPWFTVAVLLGVAIPGALAGPGSVERVLHDLPAGGTPGALDGGLDRFAVALTLADTSAALAALEEAAVPAYCSAWLRGRIANAAGDEQAGTILAEAVHLWRRTIHTRAELPQILQQIDRDRVEAAVHRRDWNQARLALRDPLVSHADDRRWQAFLGVVAHGRGDSRSGADYLDEAWSGADDLERRHWAFAWRSLAHLGCGEPEEAAGAWLDFVEGLAWPAELRDAVRVWDENPSLRAVVEREDQWLRAIRWQVRILRREDALATALRGWKSADDHEGARCFVEAAEQLYRLRRHDELNAHLAQPWPSGLEPEDRASLEAYPWGVARRGGAAVEIGRGFDTVVERYPDTQRGAEALWEAAWMYELSDELDLAQERFARYARAYPHGPFAAGAAVRAIHLALRANRTEEASRLYTEFTDRLGDGSDAASALWLGARAHERLDDGRAEGLLDLLARDHPGNPFLESPHLVREAWRSGEEDVGVVLAALHARQRWALSVVAHEVGVDLGHDQPEELEVAGRMLELGVNREGDGWLARYAAQRRRDPEAQLRALAVAWRHGRAERQARIGYQLRLLLKGRSEELDHALHVLAQPTPFARAVLLAARAHDLPASLIWGLMRRESFYDAEVVSLAGAYGLMQLLPSTARRVAEGLGEAVPTAGDLHRPLVNVRLGTAYLAGLFAEAEGNVFQALAAYNAGESNGRRWLDRVDEGAPAQDFILMISYSETRRYVYHVLRHARLYTQAYETLAPGLDDGPADP